MLFARHDSLTAAAATPLGPSAGAEVRFYAELDVTPELRVRPAVLRDPRFVLDVHLGRLAAYLRMLGFDALYQNPFEDSELVRISSEQHITAACSAGSSNSSAHEKSPWTTAMEEHNPIFRVLTCLPERSTSRSSDWALARSYYCVHSSFYLIFPPTCSYYFQ